MNQDIQKTLWAAADKLRSNMDAAEYKHVVLGLIFLKYISDSFDIRRDELNIAFADPQHELYLGDASAYASLLEDRDYYTMANVFWVPPSARWETLRDQAKQPDIGKRIDDALIAIEQDNPRLKGILDKRFARTQLEPGRLGELIDMISAIGFGAKDHAKDVLGQIYEYFLGQFANAEGKKGGQFYTPASVVKVLVEVLSPHKGKVYDPCCGSGGMFVQSEKFVASHGGKFGDISIYGQEANPTTWRLVAMNLAIRGMDFNLGKEPADTFSRNQHPDLRADYVLANPPFNISDWGGEKLASDPRWVYGTPPAGNANYGWLQHILWHLKPAGTAGVVLANGSMSSNTNNEGAIRKAMVEADVVEVMVALPPQLFFNTQIPACLWFLTKDKSGKPPSPLGRGAGGEGILGNLSPSRDRRGEILFIDARKLGRMATRVTRVFDDEDIDKIGNAVHAWRGDLPPLSAGEGTIGGAAGDLLPLPVGEGRGEGTSKNKPQFKLSLPEDLLEFARELRQHSTDAEQKLWSALRDRRMAGAKFRCQHPIKPYILDFYCHELKLAIELDGGQHNTDEGHAHDERRSRYFAEQGIQILRFWNNDLFQQPEAVLQTIFNAVHGNLPSPLAPLPRGEGNCYQDIPGFCRAVKLDEIKEHGYVLTPGRYVGSEAVEDDDEAFADKMDKLTAKLSEQMAKGNELDAVIRERLGRLGYAV